MLDPKLLWFRSTERTVVQVEGQNFVPDDEGYIAVPENLGSYIMRIPGFVYVGREREQDQKPVEPNFVKTPTGGRPEKFSMISGSKLAGTFIITVCHLPVRNL